MLAQTIPATDGRRRRSEVSRDRIVVAMMALVEDGAIAPSAEDVAARAQVGLRSVFRHFKDMESLYGEMTLRLAQGYADALVPFEASDRRGQLSEAMARRFEIYERLLPFKRASDAHRHESPTIEQYHRTITQLLRTRLQALIPAGLEGDELAFESLDMLLSIDTWARLRQEQQLPADVARRIIDHQVRLLIGD